MTVTNASSDSEFVDAVVVGSGFGASVAAYKLAAADKSVVVLERGKAYPPGSFARTPAQMGRNFWDPSAGMYGLFDAWTFRGLEGIVSSGLGGGSLIYANVLLRKDEKWFVRESPVPGGGYEDWPFSRADLDPHYDNVEAMLTPVPYPYQDTPKTMAMEAAARTLGRPIERPPLAITFGPTRYATAEANLQIPDGPYKNFHGQRRVTCLLCGECDVGCNVGAKNTLDHTYLSAAKHQGADIRTLSEVRGFRPLDGGGYEVTYVVHDPAATGSGTTGSGATADLPVRRIRCHRLILGAGTFGSTFLLLRNRASLPGISPLLGTRFSGNGDLLTLMLNAKTDAGGVRSLTGDRGPVITTAMRVPDTVDGGSGRGFYIEDAGYPGFINWLMETSLLPEVVARVGPVVWQLFLNRLFHGQRSNISRDLAAALGDGHASASVLPLLGMGRDVPDGVMTLSQGRLEINWTLATSKVYYERMRSAMEEIATALHARFEDTPLWWAKRVITVHPLGGAPAAQQIEEGVCDEYGQVFGYPGLYVLDGAAMPGPVGANPSLTIAAFSDRASEHMLDTTWAKTAVRHVEAPAASVPEPGPAEAQPPPTTLSFTERMRGPATIGIADPARGALNGRIRGHDLMFELTITATDLAAFTRDPLHPASASGYVMFDALGGRLEVEQGWFNLFVHPAGLDGRRMLYRLWLRDVGGSPLTLVGYKEVSNRAGFTPWRDTTTLFVHVLDGHIAPPEPVSGASGQLAFVQPAAGVRASGIIHISPWAFARQLTTFRTTGPAARGALLTFGRLFVGEVAHVYLRPRRPLDTN
ncbi:GMC oxidoreductase [Cryobacterium sp. CG_9.6]|uniref:GMC oxidoreductase n=1 Tax=Cryobacterium sp. CG_9.6 TaxID=2760710 RepID=UPI002473167E|nr:GMC oxidoreductase [Cryobacterium sp. CG_9.6]MDH6236033.1 cholesterol oxidase [Cryobacterium sp. CG_9.6]